MIHSTDPSNLVKDTYETTLVDNVDLKDIHKLVHQFGYENAKIILNGNNILERDDIQLTDPLTDIQKEVMFN